MSDSTVIKQPAAPADPTAFQLRGPQSRVMRLSRKALGFERLYVLDRQPGLIRPVACWAHAWRKLHDVYKADPHSAAAEGLKLLRRLYGVERGIGCDPADDRGKARKLSRLRTLNFFAWADGVLAQISARSPLAEALRYAVKLKPQLLTIPKTGGLRSTTTSRRMPCAA